jgi:hypothetical protein
LNDHLYEIEFESSFASTMVGQSEQLIQDKNKDMMKAIIGID